MAALSIVGAIAVTASVCLLVVSLLSRPESRARFVANWWALAFAYIGVVLMLSRELIR